jgi:non-heme chloroperoxidase
MADTIFMIHGMWGTSRDWENYVPFFERRGYRCIAPTLPYHDADPRDPPDPRLGTASLLDYAEAMEAELRQLDEPPIIMGHSMGGLPAQMLAARGLARSLVLLTPAAPAGIRSLTPSVIRCFWRTHLHWGFWRKPLRQRFSEAAYATLNLLPDEEQRKLYARYGYESGRVIFEIGYWPLDRRRAAHVDETRITCPTLVIGAAQDRITPASVVRKVARKYQTVATYREFPDHAHWVLGEPGWEDVAQYVADWLEQQNLT